MAVDPRDPRQRRPTSTAVGETGQSQEVPLLERPSDRITPASSSTGEADQAGPGVSIDPAVSIPTPRQSSMIHSSHPDSLVGTMQAPGSEAGAVVGSAVSAPHTSPGHPSTSMPHNEKAAASASQSPPQTGEVQHAKLQNPPISTCEYCHKRGHVETECWTRKRDADQQRLPETVTQRSSVGTDGKNQPQRSQEGQGSPAEPKENTILYVGGVPRTATDFTFFKGLGNLEGVVDVKLVTGQDGFNRGFGYLNFETHEQATRALQRNEHEKFQVDGKAVDIAWAPKDALKRIGELPSASASAAKTASSPAVSGGSGPSRRSRQRSRSISRGRPHHRSRSRSPMRRRRERDRSRSRSPPGRRGRWSPPRGPPHRRRYDDQNTRFKLFIGGIHPTTTSEDLREHFEQWGPLSDAVAIKRQGKPRGFGFVTYTNDRDFQRSLAVPHLLEGRTVDVRSAVPRGADALSSPQPPPFHRNRDDRPHYAPPPSRHDPASFHLPPDGGRGPPTRSRYSDRHGGDSMYRGGAGRGDYPPPRSGPRDPYHPPVAAAVGGYHPHRSHHSYPPPGGPPPPGNGAFRDPPPSGYGYDSGRGPPPPSYDPHPSPYDPRDRRDPGPPPPSRGPAPPHGSYWGGNGAPADPYARPPVSSHPVDHRSQPPPHQAPHHQQVPHHQVPLHQPPLHQPPLHQPSHHSQAPPQHQAQSSPAGMQAAPAGNPDVPAPSAIGEALNALSWLSQQGLGSSTSHSSSDPRRY